MNNRRIPLMMMRARSLCGPFFTKNAKASKAKNSTQKPQRSNRLSHSAGNFITPKV